MPRARKNSKDKDSDIKMGSHEVSETRIKTAKSAISKRRYVDTEDWVEKHLKELIDGFGLQFLELTDEEFMKIITTIVDMIRGESSTLDLDVIVRRFRRNTTILYPILSSMILELRDTLTEGQIEFIVNNIGEAVLVHAPRLYKQLTSMNRSDLVDRLREYWNRYWVLKRYPILPVLCPVCKFNALMPDLTCEVCGSTVSEKALKDFINFSELLKEFVRSYSLEEIMKAINYGYVYLSSIGVKPPSENRDPLDIEIILTTNEKELLRSLIGYGK